MSEPLAFLNGQDVPVSEARLHVFDLGVVLGASVTEMLRTFAGRPYRVADHLDRLFRSLRGIGREPPVTAGELAAVIERLARHNYALIPHEQDLGIVAFITAGQNLTYLGPSRRSEAGRMTVCVHTFPLPFGLWAAKLESGQHLVTPGARQVPSDILDPRIKCRSRLPWFLADQQARKIDPDAVCVALDSEDHITETSTANVLLVKNGTIATPASGVLEGISRETVRELAEHLAIPYVPRDVSVEDLAGADEAFTSSTPYCLLPATRFNGRPIGNSKPGATFRKLLDAWSENVGVDLEKQMRQAAT